MSAPATEVRTHNAGCWRVHDDCALQRAKEVLEADQSTLQRRDRLETVQWGIASHAARPCPALAHPWGCLYVQRAREVLDGSAELGPSASGATEFATGDHDRGVAP